jgi:hypothetical protein
MPASQGLKRLIDRASPLWAGEAEVVATYFASPMRTRESDRHWLALQCYKEVFGTGISAKNLGPFRGPLKELSGVFEHIDRDIDRHHVLDLAQALCDEFSHYVAFADAHDAMGLPGDPKLHPGKLKSWEGDDILAQMRYDHREKYGALGKRASVFTEGGYCSLFSEGRKLKGRGGRDELIADACALVYDDEFGHMLKGIAGLDDDAVDAESWTLMERLTVEQMQARVRMRNEQFGYPLKEARIQEIFAGKITPSEFDYARAGLA